MKLFKWISDSWHNWREERRIRRFKMTAHYGTQAVVRKFTDTRRNARGATIKEFSWHQADSAELDELIDGKWTRIFHYPPDNLDEQFAAA